VQDEEPPPLDPDLALSIARQTELVFSDSAIGRDSFLLKHIRRNREGYVSLKLLISAYKPIKRLTCDWRVVAQSVRQCSSLLVTNPEGTKVRRLALLPPPVETPCCNSRTVVATCFPQPSPSIRDVVTIFSVCGEIIQVRVLRPGNPTSGGVRRYLTAHPDLQRTVTAFVEFEKSEAAEMAVKDPRLREGGLQVREYIEPGESRERKKPKCAKPVPSCLPPPPLPPVPAPHPGVIGDRARLLLNSKETEEDEEDSQSVDEGIHVEDFQSEDFDSAWSTVDNSEWTDLVNKTVDFVFD